VVVSESIQNGVTDFVLVSTDKAVRPTNIMGASKRIAEMVLQAHAALQLKQGGKTCLSMVRFGNVLASIPVVLVNLRTVAVGKRTSLVQPANAKPPQQGKPKITSHRPVYFGRWYDTPIYMRDDLSPGAEFDGPAIIEQSDTTTVVEPDMNLVIDAHGNMLVRVK